MKEIGGYIELDTYHLPMLHEGAIALNCGRNALAYILRAYGIKKLKIPYFICGSIIDVSDREGIEKTYYHIGMDFKPTNDLELGNEEWLYLVNFYGQLDNQEIKKYVGKYKRVIVDQANAYFQEPIEHVNTIYCCRKNFGVADGAFLYTDAVLDEELPQDESNERMNFLLGRFERTAAEFYSAYNENNKFFATEPIKRMSRLTMNLLHGIDYKRIEQRRKENFEYLHNRIGEKNQLQLHTATFMYPLLIKNGNVIRKKLQMKKIYIPTLWPAVFKISMPYDLEYKMAENILPLPIDQRYDTGDMEYMVQEIENCLNM